MPPVNPAAPAPAKPGHFLAALRRLLGRGEKYAEILHAHEQQIFVIMKKLDALAAHDPALAAVLSDAEKAALAALKLL